MSKKLGKYLYSETDKFSREVHYHFIDDVGDQWELFSEIVQSLPTTGFYWLKQLNEDEILLFHRKRRKKPLIYMHRYKEHSKPGSNPIIKKKWRIKISLPMGGAKEIINIIENVTREFQTRLNQNKGN